MPTNFELDSNNYETACQWAEAELGYLLERESGHYLEQIPNLPEATASGLERFIPTMLGAIAQDQINDPDSVYQMTKTIIEYVVAGTYNGANSRSTLTYPGVLRHDRVLVRDTGIQIGIFHTTQDPGTYKGSKRFSESSIKRNQDTEGLLRSLENTLATEEGFNFGFMDNPPSDNQLVRIGELVTRDQVFATMHRATHDIDIIVRPADAEDQKVA